jgi:hypothetical protein
MSSDPIKESDPLISAHHLNARWELLCELVGATDTDFDDDYVNVRAGFDFTIADDTVSILPSRTICTCCSPPPPACENRAEQTGWTTISTWAYSGSASG